MNRYDNFNPDELRALLRQRDRQLEGERKGSVRTIEKLDRLIGSVYEHCNAFSEPYCIAEEIDHET